MLVVAERRSRVAGILEEQVIELTGFVEEKGQRLKAKGKS